MSRDNISSGELDRLSVIAACLDVEKRILEIRHESREAAIAYQMAPPQGRIASFLRLDPITRTREEAEERADNPGDFWSPTHAWLHSSQLCLAQEIRNLAEASRAATIRVTREDFGAIKNAWDRITKAKAKATERPAFIPAASAPGTITKRYPGATCNHCGWAGARSETTGENEDCPECGGDTSWLTPEELAKETGG